MKKINIIFLLLFFTNNVFSQVVMTDKQVPNIDKSAILKLDTDEKGVLFTRTSLLSNTDISTIPNPQNGNVTFNTNDTDTLPETVTFFDTGKWKALFNKEQAQGSMDIITISSLKSPGNISITGFTPGAINLGTGTTGWTSLGIMDNRSFSRSSNSLAFSIEGMNQINNTSSEYYEYAIGVFVDDVLVAVRKYHKNIENGYHCSWSKFILNGVVNNLSIGNHTIKVMGRNIASTSNSSTQKIVYGGVAQGTNSAPCTNMSAFMSKIVLSTTMVESLQ